MSSSTAAGPAFSHRKGLRDSGIGSGDRAHYLLCRAQRLTRPLLRAAFDTLPSELRLMAEYHVGWCDANGVVTAGESGRGLRPALVLAAAGALGAQPAAAVHAAAAVEMVHNFTVIHDDIVDGDTVRRGRPAVWQLWGVDDAVLVGDALHSLAIWTLADAPAAATLDSIARLADVVIELCLGRHHDRAQDSGHGGSLAECLETQRHQRAALLGCACAIGALCAGAPSEAVAAMDRFGRELGLACQLCEDLRGIWGEPGNPSRPVGHDLMRRKHSLPVVAALESPTPAGREFAALYASADALDREAAVRAADLIARAGGKDWAQAESRRHQRAAADMLAGRPAADLLALAECVVPRDR
ncbi:polyprenyl synthetase family protein [Nocardia tengchongensis]|uniref:Polyprenyl synthetase family protein n=1 Tax=Nocardia tengchongensis TaxID=2055889 RepID=A0ABX8CWE0_9NOCA|nr:polyprenyl synthetase family protein [Nocardia tengchongensis]QVI23937.1 polyprenyl synthetase family protein [Nocardia tengchongensis]